MLSGLTLVISEWGSDLRTKLYVSRLVQILPLLPDLYIVTSLAYLISHDTRLGMHPSGVRGEESATPSLVNQHTFKSIAPKPNDDEMLGFAS